MVEFKPPMSEKDLSFDTTNMRLPEHFVHAIKVYSHMTQSEISIVKGRIEEERKEMKRMYNKLRIL